MWMPGQSIVANSLRILVAQAAAKRQAVGGVGGVGAPAAETANAAHINDDAAAACSSGFLAPLDVADVADASKIESGPRPAAFAHDNDLPTYDAIVSEVATVVEILAADDEASQATARASPRPQDLEWRLDQLSASEAEAETPAGGDAIAIDEDEVSHMLTPSADRMDAKGLPEASLAYDADRSTPRASLLRKLPPSPASPSPAVTPLAPASPLRSSSPPALPRAISMLLSPLVGDSPDRTIDRENLLDALTGMLDDLNNRMSAADAHRRIAPAGGVGSAVAGSGGFGGRKSNKGGGSSVVASGTPGPASEDGTLQNDRQNDRHSTLSSKCDEQRQPSAKCFAHEAAGAVACDARAERPQSLHVAGPLPRRHRAAAPRTTPATLTTPPAHAYPNHNNRSSPLTKYDPLPPQHYHGQANPHPLPGPVTASGAEPAGHHLAESPLRATNHPDYPLYPSFAQHPAHSMGPSISLPPPAVGMAAMAAGARTPPETRINPFFRQWQHLHHGAHQQHPSPPTSQQPPGFTHQPFLLHHHQQQHQQQQHLHHPQQLYPQLTTPTDPVFPAPPLPTRSGSVGPSFMHGRALRHRTRSQSPPPQLIRAPGSRLPTPAAAAAAITTTTPPQTPSPPLAVSRRSTSPPAVGTAGAAGAAVAPVKRSLELARHTRPGGGGGGSPPASAGGGLGVDVSVGAARAVDSVPSLLGRRRWWRRRRWRRRQVAAAGGGSSGSGTALGGGASVSGTSVARRRSAASVGGGGVGGGGGGSGGSSGGRRSLESLVPSASGASAGGAATVVCVAAAAAAAAASAAGYGGVATAVVVACDASRRVVFGGGGGTNGGRPTRGLVTTAGTPPTPTSFSR
ncbi:hypothetical protein DFJ73DRAFT_920869 [Zopfochytrium polystomum]|nr:hypothetical protein DFJ73DRAFT_920869 [Zopfochytrium polystomum]